MTILERFWIKVKESDSCWEWTASKTAGGYGQFNIGNNKNVYAHRLAYELLVGQIPEGLVIDHLCRNRACVNPDHLEPVTVDENLSRGRGQSQVLHHLGVCANGHPASESYRRKSTGNIVHCRTCLREKRAARGYSHRYLSRLAGLCLRGHSLEDAIRHKDGRVAQCRTCLKEKRLSKKKGEE